MNASTETIKRPLPLIRPGRAIDWQRHPAVVFESDDWGQCEGLPTAGKPADRTSSLETPEELDRLFEVLGRHRDAADQPALITAFVCTGNPDFHVMESERFARYADIGVDQGFPAELGRSTVTARWREGMQLGVFSPEYHCRLHHTGPIPFLKRLRATSPAGEDARRLFEHRTYSQGEHLPEFEGMTVRDQQEWIKAGIEQFRRATGYMPAAAVNSDFYPQTETVLALMGIRIVCLKASRMNTGEVVIYGTKPWNNQDPTVPMGAYDPVNDLVYLWRNVYFERHLPSPDSTGSADEALRAIRACWDRQEPAIVSIHRVNLIAADSEQLREMDRLLELLDRVEGIRYLSTREVGDLYRNGWCLRDFGPDLLLRIWSSDADTIRVNGNIAGAVDLRSGKRYTLSRNGPAAAALPCGDYRLE